MENRWLELHDSKVESVTVDKKDIILVMSEGYVHKSIGKPGRDKGTGWTQRVQLRFVKASLDGKPTGLPDRISEAEFQNDEIKSGGISLPFESKKPVLLSLIFQSGNEIQIYGDRMSLIAMEEAKYVEDFPGH